MPSLNNVKKSIYTLDIEGTKLRQLDASTYILVICVVSTGGQQVTHLFTRLALISEGSFKFLHFHH